MIVFDLSVSTHQCGSGGRRSAAPLGAGVEAVEKVLKA